MEANAKLYQDLERVLLTRDQIHEAVVKLGRQITADYAGRPPIMICILKGAAMFFTDLLRGLSCGT